jgi:3-phenylpropionate/cinnamic acid dioxygenase small subunit
VIVDRDLQQEVEQFLYAEAALLDEGRFHEWLDLLTDDIAYRLPLRESVQGAQGLSTEAELVFLDEDKASLTMRVKRLDTGLAYVEMPQSLTQRMSSNVQVHAGRQDGELEVRSNFLLFQVRHDRQEGFFVGRRDDTLRRVDGAWKIASRKILLAQPILPRGISTFF